MVKMMYIITVWYPKISVYLRYAQTDKYKQFTDRHNLPSF
jgi:hypothetical protein